MAVANSICDEVRKLGGDIVVITPDKPENLKNATEKLALKYPALADPDFVASDAFKLHYAEPAMGLSSVRPAMFFVRADGTVADTYQTENYRFALTGDQILERFKKVAVTSP